MDALRLALEDTIWGRGRLIMLVGEEGIGKTRLAHEFSTYARLRDVQVLSGHCYEGGGAPPYWPWIQALRTYVDDREPAALRTEMGAGSADIARVIDAVRQRLPDVPMPPQLGPEQARFQFFDSLTTFLQHAAARQPIVLLLDDLHWADTPSLLLLQFLTRALDAMRVLVVGACREADVASQLSLAELLAELARQPLARRLALGALAEHEVGHFLELTTGLKPTAAVVAAVYQETAGNPFFITEIVRLLVSERRLASLQEGTAWRLPLPHGIRQVIRRRLTPLSSVCRTLLEVASVMGQEVRFEILRQVTQLTSAQVLEALEEAEAARVLRKASDTVGHYHFAHNLVCATLYTDLSSVRRMRLHQEIASALEVYSGNYPEPYLAELTHHYVQAVPLGTVDKAVGYAVRAGDRATALLAYEEAASHYTVALRALEHQPAALTQRCAVCLALGEVQHKAGNNQQARAAFWQASDLARRLGHAASLAQAALGYGGMWSEVGVEDTTLIDLLQEGLAAIGTADNALRSMLLGRLAQELYLRQQGIQLSQEALDLARRSDEPGVVLRALHSRHATLWRPENLQERLEVATEIVQIAEVQGDKELALQGHYWRLTDLLERGDLPAVDAALHAYAQLATALRQPLYQSRVAFRQAMRAMIEGRFADAEGLAQQALVLGQRAQNQTSNLIFGVQLWTLRREQGRLSEVEAALRSVIAHYPTLPAWRAALIYLHSELGRMDEARAGFELLAAHDFTDLPRDAFWLIALTLLAGVCTALHDLPRAARLYGLLLPFADRHVVIGRAAAAYYGVARRPLALLATVLERWHDATQHFEAALTAHARMGARPWLAHTQYAYAVMLLKQGQAAHRSRASALLQQASNTARELEMPILRQRAETLRETAAALPIPQAPLAQAPVSPGSNRFSHEGDSWAIVYHGRSCRLRDSKGLHYLASLLREPGREFHVLDLVALVGHPLADLASRRSQQPRHRSGGAPAGPVLDAQARRAYRRRLADLQETLREAQRHHDTFRAAHVQQEMAAITDELAQAYGLGGRTRILSDNAERARKAVRNRIQSSLDKIQQACLPLAQHLSNTINTGTFCSYTPDTPTDWEL
jgi:tetratricopeptide (TPR) repeat protein